MKKYLFLLLIIILFSCSVKQAPDEFINNAQYEYNNGNYKKAINNINKAFKLSQNKSDLYYFRALCYMELDNYKKANRDLKKSIDIKPTHDRLNNYAYTYFKLNKYQKAVNYYTKAISLNEKNHIREHSDFYMRGSIFSLIKNYDFSIRDLTVAAKLNKNDTLTFTNRGITYFSSNDYINALNDFEKAVSLDNSNITAYVYLIKISLSSRNKYQSVFWAEKLAVQIEKLDKETIYNSKKEYTGYFELIADVYQKNNDLKNYLKYLDKALKLSPSKKQNKKKYDYTLKYLKINNYKLYKEINN